MKREQYHRVERAYGTFSRSFTLPNVVDTEKIKAEFKDGVLRVTLPQARGSQAEADLDRGHQVKARKKAAEGRLAAAVGEAPGRAGSAPPGPGRSALPPAARGEGAAAHIDTTGGQLMANVKPLRDRVLVRRIEEAEQKVGGIIIPDTAKEKPLQAEVIAVGSGRLLDNGQKVPLDPEGRRQGPDRQVVGHRGQDRRRGVLILKEDEILGNRPLEPPVRGVGEDGIGREHGEGHRLSRGRPGRDPARRQRAGRRGQGDPRPQGPQRRSWTRSSAPPSSPRTG